MIEHGPKLPYLFASQLFKNLDVLDGFDLVLQVSEEVKWLEKTPQKEDFLVGSSVIGLLKYLNRCLFDDFLIKLTSTLN